MDALDGWAARMTRRGRRAVVCAAALACVLLALAACGPALASNAEYVAKFDRDDRAINDGQGYSAMTNDDGWLAWSEAYMLDAYVDMYYTTHDRRYLDSLVDQFDRVLKSCDEARGMRDYFRKKVLPGWGSSKYSNGRWKDWAVHTGMICLGPIDFVQLVHRDRRLRRDYGAKAAEYQKRIAQCVAAFDADWRNGPSPDEGYYNDPEIGPLPLNQQNSLGLVELVLYQLTGTKQYYYHVRRLAYYFKHRIRYVPGGAYDWAYNPKPDNTGAGSEDISHASTNVEFAIRCSRAQIVFDDNDLHAFGKTWEKVRRGPGEWADAVDGSGGTNTYMPFAAGAWLDLARWEPVIYDDARAAFEPLMDTPVNGGLLMGIARLARWEVYFRTHKRPAPPPYSQ